jgi:hypothetical protein
VDSVVREAVIAHINSVEHYLTDYRTFTSACRETLANEATDFHTWFCTTVLDLIDDHGYWADPFPSYSEIADLGAVAYAIEIEREKDLVPVTDFGASAVRESSIETLAKSSLGYSGLTVERRRAYLARVIDRVLSNPSLATLNEAVPQLFDVEFGDLTEAELNARRLLLHESRRGCLAQFVLGGPSDAWRDELRECNERLRATR